MADTELTELVAIDPTRLDGVKSPANGLPFLIMKSVAKDVDKKGNLNEAPDISAAEEVMRALARLIQSEARELEAGFWDEVCDIEMLADAARTMKWFRCREQLAADGESAMKSLEAAVSKRATELGVTDPMSDESASKDTTTDPTPDPIPATEDAPVEKSTEELIAEAIAKSKAESDDALAKAMSDRDETIKGLRDEMAALRKTEIPGSPFVTNATVVKSSGQNSDSGDLERFRRLAKSTQDRELQRYYATRVRELEGSQN